MHELLIISFSDITRDARVLKQVAEFSKDFRVTTCGYGDTPPGSDEHFRIPDEDIFWAYNRVDLILRRYSRAYSKNAAVKSARKQLSGRRFDVILSNEIDTVPLSLSLNPRFGVHADLHEYSPREKEDVLRWRLFVGPFRKWLCGKYLPSCASVTTVSSGLATEYEKEFGIKADLVMNATPYHSLSPSPVTAPIKLVHSGACLRDRNPMVMLEAATQTKNEVTLDLYLTPNDPGYLEELKNVAKSASNITVHDPVPYAQLVRTLNNFDIGITVLPPVNFNNYWALPNKIFDFIQARLGVIAGPSPEMMKIVNNNDLGIVAKGFSADDLTKVFDALSPSEVKRWKQNSDDAADRLSSASQVLVWRGAVNKIIGTATP